MKKILIAAAMILIVSVNFAGVSSNEKVTICHRTGNGSSHSITVDTHAVPAHMAHGDAIGECSPPPPPTLQ